MKAAAAGCDDRVLLRVATGYAQWGRALSEREKEEVDRLQDYVNVLATAAADNRDAYQLNGAEQDELVTLVGDRYDRPAVWASNLLCAQYGRCRAPYTGNAGAPKSRRTRERSKPSEAMAAASFGIQPNPARSQVAFTYDRTDGGEQGRIVIRDLAGRVVAELLMNGQHGQQLWDPQGTAPGAYLVQYLSGNQVLHTQRLVIQR